MIAVSQGYRVAGGKGFVQGVIKVFIEGNFVAHWKLFEFVVVAHRFAFNLVLDPSLRRACHRGVTQSGEQTPT